MKTVGFFSEMALYEDSGSVKNHIVDKIDYDRELVINYLNSFKVQAVCAREAIDCVTGEKIASGFNVINDGEYEGCDFLQYHILKYNIALPNEFIEKIEKQMD